MLLRNFVASFYIINRYQPTCYKYVFLSKSSKNIFRFQSSIKKKIISVYIISLYVFRYVYFSYYTNPKGASSFKNYVYNNDDGMWIMWNPSPWWRWVVECFRNWSNWHLYSPSIWETVYLILSPWRLLQKWYKIWRVIKICSH